MKTWKQILETPCPTCKVQTGRCVNTNGEDCIGIVHPARA